MNKDDAESGLKRLYRASAKEPAFVDVPAMDFLMVDGSGDPNGSQEFQEAVQVLYTVAYTLKFMLKKRASPVAMPVMPLEGLWWSEDPAEFDAQDRASWRWTAMMVLPEPVGREHVAEALELAREKPARPGKRLPALDRPRCERFHEGLSAQVLHIGPFSEEGPTVQKLHAYLREHGRELRGKHHEIYLSDPRRTPPEKWRTIIRQPCA